MKKVLSLSVLLFALLFLLFSGAPLRSEVKDSAGYVGVDTCKGCHQEYFDRYARSVHSKKAIPNSPANRYACESCHGPGADHVAKSGGKGTGIFAFGRKNAPKDKAARCLACHEETKPLVFWSQSRHKAEDVSCDSCHSIHRGGEKFLKADKSEVCYACHRDIRAMTNKQSHHPIREGKVSCSSCHNPHGEFGPKMIKADSVNELCFNCHAEKRGPFMWEHPPVEENCMNCHIVHGSNHNRLLVMKAPQLCQQCHDGAFHPGQPWTKFSSFEPPVRIPGSTAPAAQLVGRACLNCHNDVHGTNGPSAYGQRFLK